MPARSPKEGGIFAQLETRECIEQMKGSEQYYSKKFQKLLAVACRKVLHNHSKLREKYSISPIEHSKDVGFFAIILSENDGRNGQKQQIWNLGIITMQEYPALLSFTDIGSTDQEFLRISENARAVEVLVERIEQMAAQKQIDEAGVKLQE